MRRAGVEEQKKLEQKKLADINAARAEAHIKLVTLLVDDLGTSPSAAAAFVRNVYNPTKLINFARRCRSGAEVRDAISALLQNQVRHTPLTPAPVPAKTESECSRNRARVKARVLRR